MSWELPVVHMGRSVDEFYDHLKTSSDAGRKLPNWCVVHFAYPLLFVPRLD